MTLPDMSWTKRGVVFEHTGEFPWSRTHVQIPTALLMDDRIRIYYATRNKDGRSLTSFFDVSRDDPGHVLYRHSSPILQLGRSGTFDEDGVMVSCVIADSSRIFLYYIGFTRCVSVPYHTAIGLAVSTDGGVKFQRMFEGPILDRSSEEPFFVNSHCVLLDSDGLWKMWYGSGLGWLNIDGRNEATYAIKYAESHDGVAWSRPNILCIEPLHPLEANTRPSVVRGARNYEMWFSYRDSRDFRDGDGAYRLGRALSSDGKLWQRQPDPSGFELTGESWDGKMVAYPNVIAVDDRLIMFYNGNGFGRYCIGYATMDLSK